MEINQLSNEELIYLYKSSVQYDHYSTGNNWTNTDFSTRELEDEILRRMNINLD